MPCNPQRVDAVASVFADVGLAGIEAFDEEEPEYETLVTLSERFESDAHLALLSVMAGLSDFQLAGDAQQYWNTLEEVALEHGSLESTTDVNAIMGDFLDKSVNARYTSMKRDRLVKLIENGYLSWFLDHYPIDAPGEVWERTAIDLGSRRKMNSKTVVLAMKILDIHNLIINGTYLDFPDDIDIPVDVHVKRVARFAGITTATDEDDVRTCWANVAERVSAKLGISVSLLRIDSIVFQFGQLISKADFDPQHSRTTLIDHAVGVGIDPDIAERLAEELTVNLDGAPTEG